MSGVEVVLRRIFALGLCVLFLSGCLRTSAEFGKMADSWLGRSERDLVSAWGPPSGVFELDGDRLLTWRRAKTEIEKGEPPTYRRVERYGKVFYEPWYDGEADEVRVLECSLTFVSREGRLVDWRSRGNDCLRFDSRYAQFF